MLRKFVLVAAMALFEPGSTVQLMVAQLICFGYVLTVVILKPYKKNEADFTNAASGAAASPPHACGVHSAAACGVLRIAGCREGRPGSFRLCAAGIRFDL